MSGQPAGEDGSREPRSDAARRELGTMLASARQARDLAPQDVADRLRLSVSVVEAIENGDADRVPMAYLSGHARSIAQVVGADPEALRTVLAKCNPGLA